MYKKTISFIIFLFICCIRGNSQTSNPDAYKVAMDFYRGWQRLSTVTDFNGDEADVIECQINALAEGGDDCLNKSQIDLPREFEILSGEKKPYISSMRLGPYMADFKKFMKEHKGEMIFSKPQEIEPVKGISYNNKPSYFCYTIEKRYTWNGGSMSKVLNDTIWIKSSNNRISGIRNYMGGSGKVSSHTENHPINQNPISLKLQADILYDQRKYEEAFKIYRFLAYNDYTNFEAQYNLIMMEHKGLGCKWMGDKVRKAEMAWFFEKNKADEGILGTFTINAMMEGIRINPQKLNMPYTEQGTFSQLIARTQRPCSEGMMVVRDKHRKYGYANELGQIVIPCQFDYAYSFDGNGRAAVMTDGKLFGFVDTKGEIVIPCQYESAQTGFIKGRAYCVKDNKTYLIDTTGNILKVINKKYKFLNTLKTTDYAFLQNENKNWDVYDYKGNLLYSDCRNMTINYLEATVSLYSQNHNSKITSKYNW